MLKTLYSKQKTNSFYPDPWALTPTPFPAFRGVGARYKTILAVANGYQPNWKDNEPNSDGFNCPRECFDINTTKIIKTAKGTTLLVPCSEKEDEKILLITMRGGFRGYYSKIEAVGAEIIRQDGGNMHCCPTEHLIVRLTKDDGYVVAETGNRGGYGTTEVFSWKGYQCMDTEEWETMQDIQNVG